MHMLTAKPVTPAPMLMLAAATAAGFGFARREPISGPTLNHWDEAAAFLGCASLSRMVASVWP
jgi:hypothetical protein